MKRYFLSLILRLFDRLMLISQESKYIILRKKFDLDSTFRFNGKNIEFYGNGQIICGSESYIGENSTIQSTLGNVVKIGKGCMISHNVRLYTSTAIADQNFEIKPHKEKKGDIIIGNYVWIGANVFINPGVIIEDNSVIGANSVVTKNVSKNTIVGGVPAKLIRNKIIDAD